MLLIALGSDSNRYTGETWAEQVDADAKSQGIYTRFSADPALPVNRDNACLLIYNAMQETASLPMRPELGLPAKFLFPRALLPRRYL